MNTSSICEYIEKNFSEKRKIHTEGVRQTAMKLAEKYGFAFVDLYSPLMNLETGEIYPDYTTDGGHLTEKGYEVLTKQITPVLEAELK